MSNQSCDATCATYSPRQHIQRTSYLINYTDTRLAHPCIRSGTHFGSFFKHAGQPRTITALGLRLQGTFICNSITSLEVAPSTMAFIHACMAVLFCYAMWGRFIPSVCFARRARIPFLASRIVHPFPIMDDVIPRRRSFCIALIPPGELTLFLRCLSHICY